MFKSLILDQTPSYIFQKKGIAIVNYFVIVIWFRKSERRRLHARRA